MSRPFIKPLCAAIMLLALFLPTQGQAQNNIPNLTTERVRPPIPVSRYSGSYTETDRNQDKYSLALPSGKSRNYNAYAPMSVKNSDRPRPVIVLLHGAQRTGASLVERWKPLADLHGVILLGPHAEGGWTMDEDARQFIPMMIADAAKHYKIDPKRIYLFGHSMGARFTCYLAAMYPNLFAAAGFHAGMFNSPEHYKLLEQDLPRRMPMVSLNGTDDSIFPLDQVTGTARAFARNGHETRYYILEDHNHWYYDIAGFINDKTWSFFEKHPMP